MINWKTPFRGLLPLACLMAGPAFAQEATEAAEPAAIEAGIAAATDTAFIFNCCDVAWICI